MHLQTCTLYIRNLTSETPWDSKESAFPHCGVALGGDLVHMLEGVQACFPAHGLVHVSGLVMNAGFRAVGGCRF